MPNDDSDIKIFRKKQEDADPDELEALAEQFGLQHHNGNLEKAKDLGKRLAFLTPDKPDRDMTFSALWNEKFLAPSVLYQIRVLIVFAAQTTLHRVLPLPMLSTSAVNAMFDKLLKIAPGFYTNISDGAAFTFYYLALRKGNEVNERIGSRFAMICGHENDAEFVKLGTDIYLAAAKRVAEIAGEYDFV